MSWIKKKFDRAKKDISGGLNNLGNNVLDELGLEGKGGGLQTAIDMKESYDAATRDATTPPSTSDEEIQAAARAQRRRYGRAATLLTGGAGLTDLAPTARRTLLGS